MSIENHNDLLNALRSGSFARNKPTASTDECIRLYLRHQGRPFRNIEARPVESNDYLSVALRHHGKVIDLWQRNQEKFSSGMRMLLTNHARLLDNLRKWPQGGTALDMETYELVIQETVKLGQLMVGELVDPDVIKTTIYEEFDAVIQNIQSAQDFYVRQAVKRLDPYSPTLTDEEKKIVTHMSRLDLGYFMTEILEMPASFPSKAHSHFFQDKEEEMSQEEMISGIWSRHNNDMHMTLNIAGTVVTDLIKEIGDLVMPCASSEKLGRLHSEIMTVLSLHNNCRTPNTMAHVDQVLNQLQTALGLTTVLSKAIGHANVHHLVRILSDLHGRLTKDFSAVPGNTTEETQENNMSKKQGAESVSEFVARGLAMLDKARKDRDPSQPIQRFTLNPNAIYGRRLVPMGTPVTIKTAKETQEDFMAQQDAITKVWREKGVGIVVTLNVCAHNLNILAQAVNYGSDEERQVTRSIASELLDLVRMHEDCAQPFSLVHVNRFMDQFRTLVGKSSMLYHSKQVVTTLNEIYTALLLTYNGLAEAFSKLGIPMKIINASLSGMSAKPMEPEASCDAARFSRIMKDMETIERIQAAAPFSMHYTRTGIQHILDEVADMRAASQGAGWEMCGMRRAFLETMMSELHPQLYKTKEVEQLFSQICETIKSLGKTEQTTTTTEKEETMKPTIIRVQLSADASHPANAISALLAEAFGVDVSAPSKEEPVPAKDEVTEIAEVNFRAIRQRVTLLRKEMPAANNCPAAQRITDINSDLGILDKYAHDHLLLLSLGNKPDYVSTIATVESLSKTILRKAEKLYNPMPGAGCVDEWARKVAAHMTTMLVYAAQLSGYLQSLTAKEQKMENVMFFSTEEVEVQLAAGISRCDILMDTLPVSEAMSRAPLRNTYQELEAIRNQLQDYQASFAETGFLHEGDAIATLVGLYNNLVSGTKKRATSPKLSQEGVEWIEEVNAEACDMLDIIGTLKDELDQRMAARSEQVKADAQPGGLGDLLQHAFGLCEACASNERESAPIDIRVEKGNLVIPVEPLYGLNELTISGLNALIGDKPKFSEAEISLQVEAGISRCTELLNTVGTSALARCGSVREVYLKLEALVQLLQQYKTQLTKGEKVDTDRALSDVSTLLAFIGKVTDKFMEFGTVNVAEKWMTAVHSEVFDMTAIVNELVAVAKTR